MIKNKQISFGFTRAWDCFTAVICTPNHLMYGRNIRTKSKAVVPESIVQDFSKRYKYISKLVKISGKSFKGILE